MTSRSEEVYIILRAIGAAAARRDVDKVADALGRLNSETGDHQSVATADTKATELNTVGKKKNTTAVKANTVSQKEANKTQKQVLSSLDKVTKKEFGLTKTMLENYKARQKINGLIERANAQSKAAELKADRAYEAEKRAIRNQTLRSEAESTRRLAREQRERLTAQRKANLEQIRLDKQAARSRTKFKIKVPRSAGFQSPVRVAAISSLAFVLVDALNFLATGANAVAAGAIAAVNGLAPLSGMLVTLPAGLLAAGQGAVVLKLALGGIAKAMKSDEALEKLPENARQFVLAARILKTTYTGLQRSVQNNFFKDMGDEALLLGNKYLPVLNRELNYTAKRWNASNISFMRWTRSNEGFETTSRVITYNAEIFSNWAEAMDYFGRSFLRVISAAGPMMFAMAHDVKTLSRYLDSITKENGPEMEGFFIRSYLLLKRVGRVTRDYGIGLYNIFKLSAPMSKAMGDETERIGKNFRTWTESEEGIEAISKYFAEMQPNLKEVGLLAWAVAKGIFEIGRSPNFGKTVKSIRTELLPSLIEIIKSTDGKFLPSLIKVIRGIEVLAESGAIDAIAKIFDTAATIFLRAAQGFDRLPDWTKNIIVWALVLYGIFGKVIAFLAQAILKIGGLSKALKALTFGKGFLASLTTAATLATGGGAAAAAAAAAAGGTTAVAAGGSGKEKGKGKNAPKTKAPTRLGGVAGGALGAATGATLIQPLLDLLNRGGANQGKEPDASGSADRIFKGASGGNLIGGLGVKDVQGLDSALSRLGNNSAWDRLNGWMGKFTGYAAPLQRIRERFAAYDSQLTNMKGGKAASEFDKIRNAAIRQKFPMDKLIEMFPGYRDQVFKSGERARVMGSKMYNAGEKAEIMSGKLNGVKIPAGQAGEKMLEADRKARELAGGAGRAGNAARLAGERLHRAGERASTSGDRMKTAGDRARRGSSGFSTMASRTGGLSGALSRAAGWASTLYSRIGSLARRAGGFLANQARRLTGWFGSTAMGGLFHGGTLAGGQASLVGEMGPEITVTPGGKFGMVGKSGPEMFKAPSTMAIIPSSASFDPFGGHYGDAPGWAAQALRTAASTDTKVRASVPRNAERKNDTMVLPNITVTGNTFTSNIDIESAVVSAWHKIRKEEEERR